MSKWVRVDRMTFIGGNRIRPGQHVEIPDGMKVEEWMEVIPGGRPVEQPREKASETDTLSRVTRASAPPPPKTAAPKR